MSSPETPQVCGCGQPIAAHLAVNLCEVAALRARAAALEAARGTPLGPLRDAIVEAVASVLITGAHVPREQVEIMNAVIDAIRALQEQDALENI